MTTRASAPQVPNLEPERIARLRRNLTRWYQRHARDLPWRRSADPYRIWVSEIMLQQTTVAAVAPYYERFVDRFPDVVQLAAAEEADVLRLWEGLGYYRRARHLHRAAQIVADNYGGSFPNAVDELILLPGVGRYTAGAIASFAFDHRAPIVEANTARLYSRLLAFEGDPQSTAGQKLLWRFAEQILPVRKPGRFNQALMDLGARVCQPVQPRCPQCPIKSSCRAFAKGIQEQVPTQQKRPQATHTVEAAVAVRRQGKFLVQQREPGERWAGLWDFPRFEINRNILKKHELRHAIAAGVASRTGVEADVGELIADWRHSVTRYRIRLLCFSAKYRRQTSGLSSRLQRWAAAREFAELPFSVTGRRLAELLSAQEQEIADS